jgi:hypothetical protein
MEQDQLTETEIFVCGCHSFEHQTKFIYNEEDNILYVYIHLNNYDSFWKRLLTGIKYIFGYSSRFGEWDEFIFKEEDQEKLRKFLNQINRKDDVLP